MQLIYNIISFAGLIAYFPRLVSKKGPKDRKRFIKERLGLSSYKKTDIWVHAVSVGEVLAALPFLKSLKKEFPEKKITLSTITYTGQNIAGTGFTEADRIMYMPFDTPACLSRAVNSLRPEIFITVETELWPSTFNKLKEAGCHLVIVNGRISNESFSGYRKLRFFMKHVLSKVDFFYMQTGSDAERIIEIGADESKVGIMGNFKFDIDLDEKESLHWLDNINGNILLAASTHKGEEDIILDAFSLIRKDAPELKLIIAPRHPERFGEVAEIIRKKGFPLKRRTEFDGHEADIASSSVILLDTIGELSRVFARIRIAFIGGSLMPYGGHNILEPAYWSKPIIFGPHMDNFPVAGDFLHEKAAIEIKDSGELSHAVLHLLHENEKASLMGQKAKAIIDKNKGAVKKAVDLIRRYIGTA
jgi:3-deoxy-D-manno-octulosonic-acid transferase